MIKSIDRNHNGYTLIEAIIVLALIGIIMIPIYIFFISNIKIVHKIDDQVEVQYQAQMAMNELIHRAMNTKGIYKVYNRMGKDITTAIGNNEISKIIFKGDPYDVCFEHKNFQLWYGYNTWANVLYANYIDNCTMEPVGNNYKDCKSIKISITSKKKDTRIILRNQIYFRNKK
jgi:prepilin-type N-terminal cleavage/methylation domain-containing protein